MSRAYRALINLYPRGFRREYGEDLVQDFGDLVADRGRRVAWTRTAADLLVTVPRFRLETVMNEQHSATVITATIALLAAGGALGVLTGIYPAAPLLVVAAILAGARFSRLARAIRTPDSTRRRRRLTIAAILGAIFAVSVVSYSFAISDEEVGTASLLIHNAIGVPAMVGCVGFLIVGLLTPRDTRPAPV